MDQLIIVDALKNPALYPNHPERIELLQTHISYILLAGDEVYKIKKPVNFGFLDFTTLEKRRFFCEEELRLNRRLAPQVYREVVKITADSNGEIRLRGGGETVEYAVRMRRLPAQGMLKRLISRPDFNPAIIDSLAGLLANFHSQAQTGGKIDQMGTPEIIRYNHDENFAQTERYIGLTIHPEQYRDIQAYVERFFQAHGPLLEKRVREHKIRDCHGDLHLEHICVLDEEIIIFDCIEFNERFRYSDTAAEVAFLAMDLDFNGYPAYARLFADRYLDYSHDPEVVTLHDFYRCYYAYVRGKVVSFRLEDPAIMEEEKEKAKKLAARYFKLAHRYAKGAHRPRLIVMAGLTGTGKSVIARELARRLGAVHLQTDVIRKELAGITPDEHRFESVGNGIYSAEMSHLTYEETRRRARQLLLEGKSVILDATHTKAKEREAATRIAKETGACFCIVNCHCPEETVKERLKARLSQPGEVSDGRWEIYLHQRNQMEPFYDSEEFVIQVDTTDPLENVMEAVFTSPVWE